MRVENLPADDSGRGSLQNLHQTHCYLNADSQYVTDDLSVKTCSYVKPLQKASMRTMLLQL
jgi:hypothetical protein